jgi:hypothetical protein
MSSASSFAVWPGGAKPCVNSPQRAHRNLLTEMAAQHAVATLRRRGVAVPRDLMVVLHMYTAESGEGQCGCLARSCPFTRLTIPPLGGHLE